MTLFLLYHTCKAVCSNLTTYERIKNKYEKLIDEENLIDNKSKRSYFSHKTKSTKTPKRKFSEQN